MFPTSCSSRVLATRRWVARTSAALLASRGPRRSRGLRGRVRPVRGAVYGLVRKVLRDLAQSEEVAQEVLLEVWRTASRFDPARGQRVRLGDDDRAPPRYRSGSLLENAATAREQKLIPGTEAGGDVAELVETTLDRQRVQRCLGALSSLQAESIKLAYYGGYTYFQVAELLGVLLGTVKTRIRDGLIRMRDCMEVTR